MSRAVDLHSKAKKEEKPKMPDQMTNAGLLRPDVDTTDKRAVAVRV
jgi:hypothetical protein